MVSATNGKILQVVFTVVLCFAVYIAVVTASECSKATRAETYLDTAVEMISKIKDNLPSEGEANCKCPPKPVDCAELLVCGYNQSGAYKIWPRNRIMRNGIDVYCDMDKEGGGWTVIQRRGDFKRPEDYFSKNWYRYKTGFGDVQRDFWLGNDNIYALTNQNKYYLRIDLTDFENNTGYAFYDQFWIDNESQNYKLHVYDYSGDVGDALAKWHNGYSFSTPDRDNDNSTENCAVTYQGGWWFSSCYGTNLNGLFYTSNKQDNAGYGITWTTWKSKNNVLQKTEMKIRPSDFKTDILDLKVDPK